ncbi:hypothetical protein [Exiguobacterium sp. s28]|uniref:hypothetical protein n=1 Tax=Exiguobacterium sp. s28 TaxID=2751238 RepID=UPI001BE937E0|nr:hypothetical protein [Exiguobacterium sp. s28]
MRAKENCGAKTKLDDMMRLTIIEKLRATWSPEQIVGRINVGLTVSDRPREVGGLRRDVHRAQGPVLPRPTNREPQCGLDFGGDQHVPWRLPRGVHS